MHATRFSSIYLAQNHYNNLYRTHNSYDPVVVLVSQNQHDHTLQKPPSIVMGVKEFNQCVGSFTLILAYLEVKIGVDCKHRKFEY